MTKKTLPKIQAYRPRDCGGYFSDNGAVAFGDPFDLIYKRDVIKEQQKEYQDMYRLPGKPKGRKKMLHKNEQLPYSS